MIELEDRRIEHANRDLGRAEDWQAKKRFLRARLVLPIRLIDNLVGELEEMNLANRRRVPRAWDRRMARLVAMLPGEVREVPVLRGNIAPSRLMDRLFQVQDALLDLKVGPVRHELLVADDPDELDVA